MEAVFVARRLSFIVSVYLYDIFTTPKKYLESQNIRILIDSFTDKEL